MTLRIASIADDTAQVALDSIGDGAIRIDISGKVTDLNPTVERMTGRPLQAARGWSHLKFLQNVGGDSREPALNPPTMAIPHNKTATPSVNTVRIRRDSEETAIEDTAAPIRDRHGMVCGTVIVFHDVGMTRAGAHAVDSPIDTLTHPSRPASGRDGICRRSVSRSTIE